MNTSERRELSAEEKLRRLVVGLAVECEIYNRRRNPELLRLYSNPDPEEIKALYERLITSEDHRDREVAIWLGLAVELPPIKIDFRDLITELQEMEFILFHLLRRVDEEAQRDLSDWMNYLANAAYSLRDGFLLDAKSDMNRALESSKRESVERAKVNSRLRYEIELLQAETSRRFEELKNLPVSLDLPEERLDLLMGIQEALLKLMRRYYLDHIGRKYDLFPYVVQRLNSALRYAMRRDVEMERVGKEMELALIYLRERGTKISEEEPAALAREMLGEIERLALKVGD